MTKLWRLVWLATLSLTVSGSASAQCLFVNTNSSPNTVAAFVVNADGSLAAVVGSPFATGGNGSFDAAVGSTGLSVGSSRLYVSNPSSDSVSGFDIAADCTLTAVPGSPFAAGSRALGLEPDPAGDFLYVTNFLGDSVSVFDIAADGSLSQIAGSPFATPSTPFDIAFDPAGGRFFVSHDFAAAVGVYDQAADGSFAPVAGSPFAAGGFEHGLAINDDASLLYVADFGPDTISGYSVGAAGDLTAIAGSPFSPGVEPIELLVRADQSLLFATNDNAENVAVLSIDGAGALAAVAGSPFASDSVGPAGLAQDPNGDFLFVANGGFSGNADVSVFSVGAGGALTPVVGSPFATGGTGNATGIAYFAAAVDLDVDVSESVEPAIAGVGAGNLVYTVTLSSAGPATATGIAVDVTTTLPAGVTLDSVTPSAGSFAAGTWSLASLASGASETLLLELTVGPSAAAGTDVVSATASIVAVDPTDSDSGNDSDSESTSVVAPSDVSATKTVSGTFEPGGAVTYTITLANTGGATQPDNPGDELIDLLPATLALGTATVVSGGGGVGTAGGDTVVWNGAIAVGASVVIEITATVGAAAEGQVVANQAQLFVDADGNGTNESMVLSDDPAVGGASDPTAFVVRLSALAVPGPGDAGLALLALLLALLAIGLLRRSV